MEKAAAGLFCPFFQNLFERFANFKYRISDLDALLKYEDFEDRMRSSDFMLFTFTLYNDLNFPGRSNDELCLMLKIVKAAVTIESDDWKDGNQKEELQKALEQQVLENGWENLIRKMFEFFNTNKDLYCVWLYFTLSDQEMYKKIEADSTSRSEVLKHQKDNMISLKNSNQEVYEKNEADATSQSEVLKQREDHMISLKSSDGVVYEMNKAAASSESEHLKRIIEDTGGEDHIPLLVVSGSLQQFIAFLEKHHDLLTSLERYKDSVKEFLNTNWNKLADWHRLADSLDIRSLLDLTSLFFCHHRMKVGWQDPCVKSQLEVKRRSDFFKNFRSFEKCSNHFLQVDPVKRKDAISFLRQSAALADIPGIVSLSGLTLQDVERKMECTLGDISECFATLIVA